MGPDLSRVLLAALALVCSVSANAQAISADDARAVRAVIEAQLDAFRKDDAARAFSYATPSIRNMFGTPENFVEMVRTQYAVVYRPASVAFGKVDFLDGEPTQIVVYTDAESRHWLALYPMQRQPDGTWRINGCYLEQLVQKKAALRRL